MNQLQHWGLMSISVEDRQGRDIMGAGCWPMMRMSCAWGSEGRAAIISALSIRTLLTNAAP